MLECILYTQDNLSIDWPNPTTLKGYKIFPKL